MIRALMFRMPASIAFPLATALGRRQVSIRTAASYNDAALALARDQGAVSFIWARNGDEAVRLTREFREHYPTALLYVATPEGDESTETRTLALRAGADDAQTTPLNVDETVARLQALRRRCVDFADDIVRFAEFRWSRFRRRLEFDGQAIYLSRTEESIIGFLSAVPGRVGTIVEISNSISERYNYAPSHSSIKVAVHNLRRKLRQMSDAPVILTEGRRGYRLAGAIDDEGTTA